MCFAHCFPLNLNTFRHQCLNFLVNPRGPGLVFVHTLKRDNLGPQGAMALQVHVNNVNTKTSLAVLDMVLLIL